MNIPLGHKKGLMNIMAESSNDIVSNADVSKLYLEESDYFQQALSVTEQHIDRFVCP